jgi:hypothetical protein
MLEEITKHYKTILFVGGGLLVVSILRFIIVKFFKDISNSFISIENHEMRLKILEKQMDDIKLEHRENHMVKEKK